MVEEAESSALTRIPSYAKLIMVLQTILILFLSFWIYNEYVNNPYLQSYLTSALPTTTITILSLGSIGFFSALAVLLVKKLRTAQKELGEVLSIEPVRNVVTNKPGFLDQRTEQHLIELIRRSGGQNNNNNTTNGPMPILRREDEEKRAHSRP